MKAKQANLLKFLQTSKQFIIPIYQRTYSWQESQCQQLLHDIIGISKAEDNAGHFVGSVVYFEQDHHNASEVPELLIIDGQQRVTTLTLLLAALAELVQQYPDVLESTSATKLKNYYLFNAEEEGALRYKLMLTRGDKQSLIDVLEGHPKPPVEVASNVRRNYEYFRKHLTLENARTVYAGLQRLFIVDVALERGVDNPQMIFESMNSTGLALSQADLIRNYVLMGQEPKTQARLYEHYWFPMEQLFGEHYANYFDWFVRDYLTLKTGHIPRIDGVYASYKTFLKDTKVPAVVEERLRDLHRYAGYYVRIVLPEANHEADVRLRRAHQDLLELRADTATPFLLEVYADYEDGHLTAEEHEQVVRLIEAYVFRRVVCGIPTNSLNKTFAALGRLVRKPQYLESLYAAFQLKDSYRRFPTDAEFKREFQDRDLYNLRLRNYILDRLENFGRKERVLVDEYTIEHILPQNENLSKAWRDELGPEWRRIQEERLHTIGNLTLTGYNSRLSDKPFAFKKTVEGGFADSPIRLNAGVAKEAQWTEDAIKRRGQTLATKALKIWVAPALTDAQLTPYREPEAAADGEYKLEQFNFLTGEMGDLFHAFQKRVLNLDATVKQEVKKLYIAFKLDTNFVDVIPQKSRLRLSLNLPFEEIRDPRNLCKDVRGLGRWGNGEAEVGLASPADLDDAMHLVRQAYEWQLEN
ncbi:GmrSD restriction endonuclease domain-containing protein [Hymenobacter sp. 102]|uniref:GmrSD restriction endonuclease domain-containing protein n=1 Tax=Hymenobacter sp. 102 TaxID=3403152 RepID=UPI003CE67488